MSTSRCPICRREVSPRAQNPDFPFCSERCRLIDLSRWLDASYRIPVESGDADEDGSGIPEQPPGSEDDA